MRRHLVERPACQLVLRPYRRMPSRKLSRPESRLLECSIVSTQHEQSQFPVLFNNGLGMVAVRTNRDHDPTVSTGICGCSSGEAPLAAGVAEVVVTVSSDGVTVAGLAAAGGVAVG